MNQKENRDNPALIIDLKRLHQERTKKEIIEISAKEIKNEKTNKNGFAGLFGHKKKKEGINFLNDEFFSEDEESEYLESEFEISDEEFDPEN